MDIILEDWMILMILVAIIILISGVTIMLTLVYKNIRKSIQERNEEGVVIFQVTMRTEDFLSFVNSCVSYLMSYSYLEMDDFLSRETLRLSTNRDFEILETCINAYPIIQCKYVGQYKFVLCREEMIRKYEVYQEVSGEDDYIIPLFENNVVNDYLDLFNFQTRYQNLRNATNILDRSVHYDEFLAREKTKRKLEKEAQIQEENITVKPDPIYLRVVRRH